MLNRAFEVKMVKKNKNEAVAPVPNDILVEGKVANIGYYLDKIVAKAGKITLAYVLLDTARKVAIAKASK